MRGLARNSRRINQPINYQPNNCLVQILIDVYQSLGYNISPGRQGNITKTALQPSGSESKLAA